ncbi:MAG: flagellar motor switch protein FliN [Acidihalobacter sp.]|jgi:flagellar motor switch protein FliN|uniref:flagellar motor switch protein FliN n=1 Tax=Acidihalobacter sp. TaxID=1872108 RepID=UPI00307CDEBB
MSADPKDPEDQAAEDAWAEALAEQAETEQAETEQAEAGQQAAEEVGNSEEAGKPEDAYEKASFGKLENVAASEGGGAGLDLSGEGTLDVILDIPVTVSMEIGRTRLPIRNLLRLNQGSVVELDRLAGEPLDVLVNGTLIAHGEVVVVNEKYGIRLTDVISPAERVRKLK